MTFKMTQKKDALNISFPATLANVDRAAEKTAKYITSHGLDEYSFTLLLGLREVLNNAVMQGSGHDRKKTVTYELRRENGRVIIQVEDEGDGFDWRFFMNRIPASHKESGRGLAILKRYFEGVEYNAKGNRVTLIKNIKPASH